MPLAAVERNGYDVEPLGGVHAFDSTRVRLVAPEVVEKPQEQSRQGCEVLLVDMAEDREILSGHVIHTVELHALVSHARRLAAPTSTIPYLG